MLTTIKSEARFESGEQVTAKVCLFNHEDMKELYLSEVNEDPEKDDEEEDHLIIQRHKEGGFIYINGKLISRDIADAIINFLK